MKPQLLIPAVLTVLTISAAHAAATTRYVITALEVVELGTLGGQESVAKDINDLGEIVGWAHSSTGHPRAFLYRDGAMTDLFSPSSSASAMANGINNLTQIVGQYSFPSAAHAHAFFWRPGTPVGALDEHIESSLVDHCQTGSNAYAINDAGVIVGYQTTDCDPGMNVSRSARWASSSGNWVNLLPVITSPAPHFAYDINDSGIIVGEELHDGRVSDRGSYIWNAGVTSEAPLPVAPPLPARWGQMIAYGLNDSGSVVGRVSQRPEGYSSSLLVDRAFFWSGNTKYSVALPMFSSSQNSVAYEINNQAFSVGYADVTSPFLGLSGKRPVIWHRDIGITQLPLPAGAGTIFTPASCVAFAVNNRNTSGVVQAVGYCTVSGVRKALLWNVSTARVATT